MECTFGESWKYFDLINNSVGNKIISGEFLLLIIATNTYHWIETNRPVPFGEAEYVPAVAGEFSAQKSINQHHLQYYIEQIEHFGDGIGEKQCIVEFEISDQIVGDETDRPLSVLFGHDWLVEAEDEILAEATFGRLPQITGHVEE